jgi:Kef-type K+ transport system membrane component KefB
MEDLFFLPKDFPQHGALLRFGVLVLIALLSGEFFARWLRLPRIVGFVAAGILLGPQVLRVMNTDALFELRVLLDIARGLILFELGQRVDLGWLRRNPWLFGTSLLEATLSFLGVGAVLLILDVKPLVAATAAAIAIGTSPAVLLSVSKELRAQGQVTERLLILTALNSVYAFLGVTVLYAWLHLEYKGGWQVILLHPLYLIAGALVLALIFASTTLMLLARIGKRPEAQLIVVIAMVVLAVAVARALNISAVLTLLSFGVLSRVLDKQRRFVSISFSREGLIFIVILFSFTGATLDFSHFGTGAVAAAGLIAVRALGKATGVFALAKLSGIKLRTASLVSIGLVPMSGTALVLMEDFSLVYPGFGPELGAVMVSAVAILELLGPLAAHYAIKHARETG